MPSKGKNALMRLRQKSRKKRIKKHLTHINYTTSKEYMRRSYLLKRMGYKSYTDYLQSKHWKRIKALMFSKYNKCSICGLTDSLVPHHLMYTIENMMAINTKWVVVLCAECHSKIHEIEKTIEKPPLFATLIYLEMYYPNINALWIKNREDVVDCENLSKGAYRKYGVFGLQAKGYLKMKQAT